MTTAERSPPRRTVLALAVVLSTAAPAVASDGPGIELFETKVRPVLAQHCYKCHSAQAKEAGKLKANLRLDTSAGLKKGGETGPVLVPGKPADSLLVKVLRAVEEAPQMPPRNRLPDAVIADFEKWIGLGAPLPRDSSGRSDMETARRHWAFRSLRRELAPPRVNDAGWAQTPVDRFILAGLEARGLSPSPQADRRTLIRRAYFDLIGLPPRPEDVEAFEADASANAWEKVVDRLLASPHYGERWGRHWLDVARYADTKDGVLMYGDDRVRPYAYTYRDYVIRAFNEDLPFDRFVHEQLAADKIEPKVEPWRLAAMGFLTLGRMFDNNVHDVIDDRIDTVCRGLLGLTVSCARCHDHKYDPVPMADYYSLYGVFASSEAPLELPLCDPTTRLPGFEAFEKEAGPKRRELQQTLDRQYEMLSETARQRAGDYLVHAATTPPDPLETAVFFMSLAPEQLRPPIISRWRRLLALRARPDDPVLGPWADLFRQPESGFATSAAGVLAAWKAISQGTSPGQLNPLVRAALEKKPLTSRADVARAYGELLQSVYQESKKSPSVANEPARRQLLDLIVGPNSPGWFPKGHTWAYMSRTDKDAFGGKVQEIDRLAVRSPAAPPRAMALYDAEQLCEPRIFLRGNAGAPGEPVPRQFLTIVEGDKRRPFPHGSGRLDLAKAITAPDNPLTARVIVNRVWMHHFGEPLVDTPSDFGLRSNPPTHPELLDYLADRLQRDSWSLKRLHRLLLLSAAYQQASFDRPECRRIDPDNKLLWRANRRRLDLEAMRDGLLAVSGRIEHRMGGRPVDIAGDPHNRRRTLYGLVDRQGLPGLYRAFDFASPDASAERRPQTTVPQQALFSMNAPFVLEQARAVAARPEIANETNAARRVAALYRLVLCRRPDDAELRAGLAFVAVAKPSAAPRLDAWQQFAQVLLLTNEVMFID